MLTPILGVLFDGFAYGGLLFLLSVGLSVTMGLMRFVNLAHGAFAMLGGYTCVTLMQRFGVPFLVTLPIVFVVVGASGALLERTLYRRLYGAGELDQVLFSIGLTLMAVAAAAYFFGSAEQPVHLPSLLRGQVRCAGLDLGAYRLFLLALVVTLSAGLQALVSKTRFGARVRAAVDDRSAAAGLGIDVNGVVSLSFALGTGLAGLGGALGIDLLGLDPSFAVKYLVSFLLAVVVGGAGSIKGTAVAALLLGVCDVAGKYFVPAAGSFVIYALMVLLLIVFPAGLYGRRS
ncbi:MAG TPA: branched-chain amino acid ABC transporter permease [Anaeromyxobacteraceae bacterium]|nr:branched-chain amino acid ABC transporter permease [Anaeromyxobacteraceae bacterium]